MSRKVPDAAGGPGAAGGTPAGSVPGALSRRLRYLGTARAPEDRQGAHPGERARSRVPQPLAERIAGVLEGWERIGELTWRRVVVGGNAVGAPAGGEAAGGEAAGPDALAPQRVSPLLLPQGLAPEDLLFFDTETTGLSGGAGSYVFLFGSARFEAGKLVCEQLFLADFPGEPEFLQAVSRRLEGQRLFLSYNGRAFDAPLLKTRFVLNRMPFRLERQEDLLYWARRLWRRSLPDCTLPTIERRILGVERALDVPGWEVPGIYLGFLAGTEERRLPLVTEHNLQDVMALARLFGQVNRLLLEGEVPPGTDGAALGGHLLRAGERRGEEVLEQCFGAGDQRAGRALSLHYKRIGQWQRAAGVWEAMALERSLFAAVELAKLHEHRLADPERALGWVRRACSWNLPLSGPERERLLRRRKRLERRCGPRGAFSPGSS